MIAVIVVALDLHLLDVAVYLVDSTRLPDDVTVDAMIARFIPLIGNAFQVKVRVSDEVPSFLSSMCSKRVKHNSIQDC